MTPSQDKPRLVVHELKRGGYQQVANVTGDVAFRATQPFAVEIVPAALVAGPWQR